MSFTRDQILKAAVKISRRYKAAGTSDVPIGKDAVLAIANAIKTVHDSAQFRAAMSNAIEGAVPGLTNAEKKFIYQAVVEELIERDLLF